MREIKVDWDKWNRQEYERLSIYGKIWHHARNVVEKVYGFFV